MDDWTPNWVFPRLKIKKQMADRHLLHFAKMTSCPSPPTAEQCSTGAWSISFWRCSQQAGWMDFEIIYPWVRCLPPMTLTQGDWFLKEQTSKCSMVSLWGMGRSTEPSQEGCELEAFKNQGEKAEPGHGSAIFSCTQSQGLDHEELSSKNHGIVALAVLLSFVSIGRLDCFSFVDPGHPALGVPTGAGVGPEGPRGPCQTLCRCLHSTLCFCFMLTNSCCNVIPNYHLLPCSSSLQCVCAPGRTPDYCIAHAEMGGRLQLVPLDFSAISWFCDCAVHSAQLYFPQCLMFFSC